MLSVIILTFNEELHIARAIESVADIASQVFVVDSFSTDTTRDIAEKLGAVVVTRPFINQADQLQWAIDTLPLTNEWVMRLDADETVGADLVEELRKSLPLMPEKVTGVNLKRKHVFLRRWIRWGGRYPVTLLRVWRRGAARVEPRWMDEHMVVLHGRTTVVDGDFRDENLQNISYFIAKHNNYATREAIEVVSERLGLVEKGGVTLANSSLQASVKRVVKVHIYNHLPLWVGPLAYFLWRYFVRFGFLDGKAGLIYHLLQGGWYRFLVATKVEELERGIGAETDRAKVLARLSALTGMQVQ